MNWGIQRLQMLGALCIGIFLTVHWVIPTAIILFGKCGQMIKARSIIH